MRAAWPAGTQALGGGLEVVSSGGVASATAVGAAGEQDVLAGGLASGTALSGGEQVVFAGGTASGTAVGAGGTLIAAAAGATVAGATVGSGGAAYVSSGGTAGGLTVSSGGTAYLGDGALLTGALTDDGALVATEAGALSIAPVIGGTGTVVQAGSGTLVLGDTGARNTYTGGSTISAGTLELAARGAAGTGAITFAPGAAATLRVDTALLPANTVSGFAPGDAIDLRAVAYDTADTVGAKGNIVTVSTAGGVNYRLAIAGAGAQGGYALSRAPEGGGTRLTTANAPITLATVQDTGAAANGSNGLQFLPTAGPADAGSASASAQGTASLTDLASSLLASLATPGGGAGALFGSAAVTPATGNGPPPGDDALPGGALALAGLSTSAGLAPASLAPASYASTSAGLA